MAEEKRPVIRVVGSLNIDFVTLTPRVPGPGETLTATSLSVNAGGKGANQAVACGRAAFVSKTEQDVRVEMIGAVGANDPYYASLLRPILEESGVSTKGVTEITGSQTGTATILVDEGAAGENRILVVPGANHAGMGDLPKIIDATAKNAEPDVVVMQGEIPRSTVLGLLKHFNSSNKTCVIFNPAPIFPAGIPLDALQGLAVLVVNETECLQLFSVVEQLRAVDLPGEDDLSEAQLKRLTNQLHQVSGITIVVVTLGARGVYYSNSGSDVRGMVAAIKVDRVVDTTGAGDTFVGYFATSLARHLATGRTLADFDTASAVGRANVAAAKCVQKAGAMQSIPFGYE